MTLERGILTVVLIGLVALVGIAVFGEIGDVVSDYRGVLIYDPGIIGAF